MFKHFFKCDWRVRALRESPDSSFLEGFAQYLYEAGYDEMTGRRHIRSAAHLVSWMNREGVKISGLNETLLGRFERHVDGCRCPGYSRTQLAVIKGTRLFLSYLRSEGIIAASTAKSTGQDPCLLVAFIEWMRHRRGTTDQVLYNYSRSIRELLTRLGEDPRRFDAKNLRKFVMDKSRRSGWASVKTSATALRMFLRFLIAEGKCAADLDAAVPVLAHWRLSSLPRYLQPEEVERVLDSVKPNTPLGRRDRAILLLLARLGLRAGDISQLRLGDIDWDEAQILVSGKGRCQSRLPLTQEVGNAIVSYLQDGRPPQMATDALFIRSRAPLRALTSDAVSMIAATAMRRAGVSCPNRGAAHVLRHSLATAMLRQGASLQDIADVLRHRSIDATEIYAKVNVAALQQIAQPWPEVQPC